MATTADDSSQPQQHKQKSSVTSLGALPGSDPELWAAQTMTYPTFNEVRRKRPQKGILSKYHYDDNEMSEYVFNVEFMNEYV